MTLKILSVIAAYAAAMWWLIDRGRTPLLAIACKRLADLLHRVAVQSGLAAWDLDRVAYSLIRKRSLA